MTIFSPYTVGRVATRRSRALPPTFMPIRPSCGTRFSAMFRSAMTLRRLIRPPWMFLGRRHHLVEHAVDAEPDPHVLLGGLDVDVRGPVADSLGHDRVHELDDRRVLERRLELLIFALDRIGRDGLGEGLDLAVHAGELLDRALDVARGGDDGLHVAVR